MKTNMGSTDRAIRIVVGIGLLAAAYFSRVGEASSWSWYGMVAVGVVLVATALVGVCPVYSLFGIRTCKV